MIVIKSNHEVTQVMSVEEALRLQAKLAQVIADSLKHGYSSFSVATVLEQDVDQSAGKFTTVVNR